jgi:hypothetical protein
VEPIPYGFPDTEMKPYSIQTMDRPLRVRILRLGNLPPVESSPNANGTEQTLVYVIAELSHGGVWLAGDPLYTPVIRSSSLPPF